MVAISASTAFRPSAWRGSITVVRGGSASAASAMSS
jgi:hypothetical protein